MKSALYAWKAKQPNEVSHNALPKSGPMSHGNVYWNFVDEHHGGISKNKQKLKHVRSIIG